MQDIRGILSRALAAYGNQCPEGERSDVADLLARVAETPEVRLGRAIVPLTMQQFQLGIADGHQRAFGFARPVGGRENGR